MMLSRACGLRSVRRKGERRVDRSSRAVKSAEVPPLDEVDPPSAETEPSTG